MRSSGATGLTILASALTLSVLRTSTTAFQPTNALAWLASFEYTRAPPKLVSLGLPKAPTLPEALIWKGSFASETTVRSPPTVMYAPCPMRALALLSLVTMPTATA